MHRYCAFLDTPIFTERHCDLKSATTEIPTQEPQHVDTSRPTPACPCSNSLVRRKSSSTIDSSGPLSSSLSSASPSPSSSSSLTSNSSISGFPALSFPFTSDYSAKICLKSALSIARSFELLPYPNPSGEMTLNHNEIPGAGIPRTMPAFACCAMQSSYAMLMLYRKTCALKNDNYMDRQIDSPASSLVSLLRHGLHSVLSALENYSIAFEALDGMRGQ